MQTNEIVDSIYKAYGTDSGILFGIKERDITTAIVEFTINRISDERQALLDVINEVLTDWYSKDSNLHKKEPPYLNKIRTILNNAKNI